MLSKVHSEALRRKLMERLKNVIRYKRYGVDFHKSRLIDQVLVGILTITDQKMKGKKFDVSLDVEAS